MRDYVVSILIAAALSVVLGAYLLFRRGYFFDAPPTADMLFVPNKVLAGAGLTLLAFTFLIGPIARYFDSFDHLLRYRKEIGIVGGFLAVFHAIVSYFFLPLKFPQARFTFDNLPFVAGLVVVFLLVFLYVISFKKIIDMMGGSRWWLFQRWGLRLVIAFTIVHVFVMKWEFWVRWVTESSGRVSPELANPWLPAAGILVSMFIAWVVIVRLYETIFLYKDLGWKPKEIVVDAELRRRGRRFFICSFWVLIAGYAFMLTRWA